MYLSVSEVRN